MTMFMEDTDEMIGMESSSSYQQSALPNYPPPSYQQATFSGPTLPQLPPSYQSNLQTPNMQNQPNFEQQNQNVTFASNVQNSNAAFAMFNSTPAPAAFPISTNPVSNPVNLLSTEVPSNSVNDANANTNADSKLTMIKSFSNESGMNEEWAKK